jgi:hypothetical protein
MRIAAARRPILAAALLTWLPALVAWGIVLPTAGASAADFKVTENDEQIQIVGTELEATIRKRGYVSGVAAGSLLDRKTGFRDAGFGLDIVDWLMEPGSDEAYRDKLAEHMVYQFNNPYHGRTAKRTVEGPQICTQAKQLEPKVIQGSNFVGVTMSYRYNLAAPGKKAGSTWTQTLVFPAGERFFISSDRIDTVNSSDALFLRLDMPGHIKHNKGDTFSEVYLSYVGEKPIPASEFSADFAPDEKFNYTRDDEKLPERFIRAYHLRDPKTGKSGPWLAGMTLNADIVSEAWCHQRGYVCLIEEFGGRPIKAGESFGAVFIVGFFDSIADMHEAYDRYAGHNGLVVDKDGWRLTE